VSDDYATERKRAQRGSPIVGRPCESREIVTEQSWRADARCKNMATDLFYPFGEDQSLIDSAKAVCRLCPVIMECREFALSRNEVYGIFGGLSEADRRRLRGQRRRAS
jgi:WhiB family redox-sensing transcriptional regulator